MTRDLGVANIFFITSELTEGLRRLAEQRQLRGLHYGDGFRWDERMHNDWERAEAAVIPAPRNRSEALELAGLLRRWVNAEPSATSDIPAVIGICPPSITIAQFRERLSLAAPDRASGNGTATTPDGLVRQAVVLATSGSTSGNPDLVVLSREALAASASATETVLGGPGDWVLALPLAHIAGVQVLLRAAFAGTHSVVPSCWPHVTPVSLAETVRGHLAGAQQEPAEVPLHLQAAAGTSRLYTSLVSPQLAAILDAPGQVAEACTLFDAILVGGGRIDPGLLDRARKRGLHVVTTYGMTETAGGCVYNGLPLPGTEIVTEESTSRVLLHTPSLMDGYVDTAADFIWREGKKYLRTADVGGIGPDGRLSIEGRADDIVNSGGVKVLLPAVADAIRRQPGIVDAACVAVDDPTWGQCVAALVVAGASYEGGTQAVREAAKSALGRPHAPRIVVFARSVPRTELGKVERASVARLVDRAIRSGTAWKR